MEIKPYTYDDVESAFHPQSIQPQPSSPLVVFIFGHAAANGRPDDPISTTEHSDVFDRFEETIANIDSLGWVDHDADNRTIALTPRGVSIAGPLYHEVKRELEPDLEPVHTDQ